MTTTSKPTAVLVHGAFADASGFGGVIREMQSAGHMVLAPPNPLRAGWKSKPSWYLVSEHDNAIAPDAERFMADRMGATTKSIAGSHTAFISQPVTVAGFITEALTAT